MSKVSRTILLACLALAAAAIAQAQDIRARIKIDASSKAKVAVSGIYALKGAEAPRRLSFMNTAPGADGLAERISVLEINGSSDGFVKLGAGRYAYAGPEAISRWAYEFDAAPQPDRRAAAHVSWIEGDSGILMLGDLLPLAPGGRKLSAEVTFELPEGWNIITGERSAGGMTFDVADAERAVFAVGKGWRSVQAAGGAGPKIAITGEWQFTDKEAAGFAAEIYSEYERIFGGAAAGDAQIMIAKFPAGAPHNAWQAETRGPNVLVLSGDTAFRTRSVQLLHEQLRHELLHLWIPNGVELTGNYDWFFEGFALYQSLKTAVRLNRIRFEDMLDTLSRAHNIDSAQTRRRSLVEASAQRWAGGETAVYARGMVTAFLCDIRLLGASGGKRSIEDVLRRLYAKHRPPAAETDGNAAVIAILKENPELSDAIEKYINGPDRIDWAQDLRNAGIEQADPGGRSGLRAIEKPRGRKKTILEKLGYNNWRRLRRSSK